MKPRFNEIVVVVDIDFLSCMKTYNIYIYIYVYMAGGSGLCPNFLFI